VAFVGRRRGAHRAIMRIVASFVYVCDHAFLAS
jgi:hypothetical protein